MSFKIDNILFIFICLLKKEIMKKFFLALTCLLIVVEPVPAQDASFSTGLIGVNVNPYGRIRIYEADTSGIRHIQKFTLLVGMNQNSVFDYQNDAGIEQPTALKEFPSHGDNEIYGEYNNSYSNLPPNILQKQHVFGWEEKKFLIIKQVIVSRELNPFDAIIGLDIITELNGSYGHDSISYLETADVIDIFKNKHLGIKLLSHQLSSLTSFEWYFGYHQDTSYYQWLTHGTIDLSYFSGNLGPVVIPALAPVQLSTGDSIIVFWGAALGMNREEMLANIDTLNILYDVITSVNENNFSPDDFLLAQNYPNPFNPKTTISFNLAERNFTTLKIYNSLGEETAILVNRELDKGFHKIDFDAKDLASGVYFYVLNSGRANSAKKMILLK
jgi:hypothetical protein